MIFHLPEAHALVAKQDLPIPAWLFAWAASIVLVASFFALVAAWRKPRFEQERWRPGAVWLTAVLRSLPLQILCGGLGVFLLGVGIYAGIHGTEAPDRNFAITFFFVTVWIGFPFASALLGDVFRAFNPWRAIARVAGGAHRLASRRPARHLAYPERLGRWPAAVGLLGFVWLEVVYGSSGGVAVGLEPHAAGVAACLQRLHAGDDGPLRHRDLVLGDERPRLDRGGDRLDRLDQLRRRRGRRLQRGPRPRRRLDRRSRGRAAGDDPARRLTLHGGDRARRRSVYLLGVQGMGSVPGAPAFRTLSRGFAHSLIPIALAYLVAHYFSLFVYQEQAQFTYLLSDPLGTSTTDLFGTAQYGIDFNALTPNLIWYIQVAALLFGHVLGLTLAHDRALVYWPDHRRASRSQYWMLAVMVTFTCFGLYLLSVGAS